MNVIPEEQQHNAKKCLFSDSYESTIDADPGLLSIWQIGACDKSERVFLSPSGKFCMSSNCNQDFVRKKNHRKRGDALPHVNGTPPVIEKKGACTPAPGLCLFPRELISLFKVNMTTATFQWLFFTPKEC